MLTWIRNITDQGGGGGLGAVGPPYNVERQAVFVPGAIEAEVFIPGAVRADTHVPGVAIADI